MRILGRLCLGLVLALTLYLAFSPLTANAYSHPSLSLVAPTPTSTAGPSTQTGAGLDTSTIITIIGVIIAALSLLVTIILAIYSNRKQRENLALQAQFERKRIEHQAEVDASQAEQERQRKQKETSEEAARAAVEQAQTTTERIQAYRAALNVDPRIAKMQILEMDSPLDITNVFVQVRLHQDARPSYELEPALYSTQAQRDPNELLRAGRLHLEQRVQAAVDPEAAIVTHRRCVFVGDPGAGKTTMLKYLAIKSANKGCTDLPDLPIHIELSEFAASGSHDLLDVASTRWDNMYGFPKAEARLCMEAALQKGEALLLLDALDQTVIGMTNAEADASYKRVSDAIAQVATRYHQAPIVVTARKAAYYQHARLAGFTELEVLEFRQEEIERFIRQWFAHATKIRKGTSADELIKKLARNARLQALAGNPLLLSLIVIVYEDRLELPDKRAELYKDCVEILLTKWDTSREIRRRQAFPPTKKHLLLKKIAWHFHKQGQRYVREGELLTVIADFLPALGIAVGQDTHILEEIVAENGLLKEQARHWYGFLHLTLQEYFAALYVANSGQLADIIPYIGDPWWEEVLLLYAGCKTDASPLLQKLIGSKGIASLREDLFKTNLLLAGRCLATRPDAIMDTSLRPTIIAALFKELQDTPYSLQRKQVAEVLVEIGGTEITDRLLQMLRGATLHTDVQRSIVDALGTLGERSVAPALLALLTDTTLDGDVRRSIVDALGTLGERSVAPTLLALLKDTTLDPFVRRGIAQALGTLGERSIAPALLALLTDTTLHSYVRRGIANALGTLGERSIAPALLALLKDTTLHPDVRGGIAQALGTLGDRTIAPALLALLQDTTLHPDVRWNIAQALGTLGERSVVPALLALFTDTTLDIFVRTGIAQSLGNLIEDPATLADAVSLVQSSEVADDIFSSVWKASRRMGVRVYVTDEPTGKQEIEIVPMHVLHEDATGR